MGNNNAWYFCHYYRKRETLCQIFAVNCLKKKYDFITPESSNRQV